MAKSTHSLLKLLTARLAAMAGLVGLGGLVGATTLYSSAFSRAAQPEQFEMHEEALSEAPGEQMLQKVLREGTTINKAPVTCRASGDRLQIMFSDYRRRMSVLENLAAQRILKAVIEDSHDTSWVVSGTVTEFKGRNYLLITRAQRGVNEPTAQHAL